MKKHLEKLGNILEEVNLKDYNTYKIKKVAKYLFLPNNVDSLIAALRIIQEKKEKFLLIGNGSNIILSDKYFDGIVIKLSNLNKINIDGNVITCESGVMMPFLVMTSIAHNLKGLEWAFGIPGNLGGSICGNAGAYNFCIFDYIESVTFINEKFEIKTLLKEELDCDYRTSFFKKEKDWIIVSANLKLEKGKKNESLAIIEDRLQRRKASQPLEYPSAGSVFRNPENNFAGKLIEDLGLKNMNIGGAYVSEKHANFIINKDNATGKDIKKLIAFIKKRVLQEFKIDLILEQEFIDW